ncbi:MAG: transposase family protein [Planctomycetota bacterium]|nr:transposase family protein [Planctomycetota bacterium]
MRVSSGKDDVWAWDIVFDRTGDGRGLKWLTLVDDFTRECLALEARRVLKATDVQAVLARVVRERGGPRRIRSDNGPEFASEPVQSWAAASGFGTLYIAPGSPWQNGFAESFHSRLRDEFLEREEFD